MKKLYNPNPNGGFPLFQNDLLMVQDEIANAYISMYAYLEEAIILSGCSVSNVNTNAQTLTISAGLVLLNGKIIPFAGYAGQYPVFIKETTADTAQRIFKDGNLKNALITEKTTTDLVQPVDDFIKFDPFSSQYLNLVIKRKTATVGDTFIYTGLLTKETLPLFDNTGLGKWDFQGFALCNGSNGTKDLRERFIVGRNPANTDYDNIGDTGGAASVTLTANQSGVRDHTHTADIPIDNNSGATVGTGSSVSTQATVNDGTGNIANNGVRVTTISTSSGSALEAHENRPPFFTVAFYQKI